MPAAISPKHFPTVFLFVMAWKMVYSDIQVFYLVKSNFGISIAENLINLTAKINYEWWKSVLLILFLLNGIPFRFYYKYILPIPLHSCTVLLLAIPRRFFCERMYIPFWVIFLFSGGIYSKWINVFIVCFCFFARRKTWQTYKKYGENNGTFSWILEIES